MSTLTHDQHALEKIRYLVYSEEEGKERKVEDILWTEPLSGLGACLQYVSHHLPELNLVYGLSESSPASAMFILTRLPRTMSRRYKPDLWIGKFRLLYLDCKLNVEARELNLDDVSLFVRLLRQNIRQVINHSIEHFNVLAKNQWGTQQETNRINAFMMRTIFRVSMTSGVFRVRMRPVRKTTQHQIKTIRFEISRRTGKIDTVICISSEGR